MSNDAAKKWMHDFTYVNFKKKQQVDSCKIHKMEFYEQIKQLKEAGYKQIEHTTVRSLYKENCFALSELQSLLRLTWRDKAGYHQRWTNFKDDKKNNASTGGSVIRRVKDKFKARTGIAFKDAFGEVPQTYKRCVPGLFHFDNPMFLNGEIKRFSGVYKYDFTSHFPACACDALPDANTLIQVEGRVEPTADYPFAFYPCSGFVAEYGKYDTRDWYDSIFGKALFESDKRKWRVQPHLKEETTILMKASTETIEPELTDYYNLKATAEKGSKERDEAKVVLLKIIGQMEMNSARSYKNNPYAHLASIIKARAIYKMLQLIDKIGIESTIEVVVDGVLVKNKLNRKFEDDNEQLGSLKCEARNAMGWFKGHNQYVLKLNDTDYDIAHAGYDLYIGPDISKWEKSPAMHLREMIRDMGINIEDFNEKYGYEVEDRGEDYDG